MFNLNSKLFAMVIALRAYTCYICLLKANKSAFVLAHRTYICCNCAIAIALRHCHCVRKTSAFEIVFALCSYDCWP